MSDQESERSPVTPAFKFEASDGQIFEFATSNDVLAYAQDERQKWNWLRNSPARNYAWLAPLSTICDSLDVVGTSEQEMAQKSARMADYFRFTPAIHSRTELQPFLSSIAERSETEAVWTLGWLAYLAGSIRGLDNPSLQWNQPGLFTGLASAWQWHGRLTHREVGRAALEHVESAKREAYSIRDQVATIANAVEATHVSLGVMATDAKRVIDKTVDDIAEFRDTLAGRLRDIAAEKGTALETEWKNLAKTYDEQLKLKAPAKYWEEKRDEHMRLAKTFSWASGIAGATGAVGIAILFHFLLKQSTVSMIPPWDELLPSVVLGVVFLWLMRTLMRLTMSHIHLSLDAGERRTMVTCYLAMTKEGATSGDERTALFATIFRPTGDGIVKDETPPIPLWEMLKAGKPS